MFTQETRHFCLACTVLWTCCFQYIRLAKYIVVRHNKRSTCTKHAFAQIESMLSLVSEACFFNFTFNFQHGCPTPSNRCHDRLRKFGNSQILKYAHTNAKTMNRPTVCEKAAKHAQHVLTRQATTAVGLSGSVWGCLREPQNFIASLQC